MAWILENASAYQGHIHPLPSIVDTLGSVKIINSIRFFRDNLFSTLKELDLIKNNYIDCAAVHSFISGIVVVISGYCHDAELR